MNYTHTHTHTHTHTRCCMCTKSGSKCWTPTIVDSLWPICILLKQETVSGSGISWAVCKSAPCSRQKTMPAPHHSDFYRPDALPAAQPKHWRHQKLSFFKTLICNTICKSFSINGMVSLHKSPDGSINDDIQWGFQHLGFPLVIQYG